MIYSSFEDVNQFRDLIAKLLISLVLRKRIKDSIFKIFISKIILILFEDYLIFKIQKPFKEHDKYIVKLSNK